jgi:hypothetical protein
MKKISSYIVLFSLGLLVIATVSCERDYYVPFDREISDVSFSEDLIPIFDASCNMSGCHSTNGVPPDLTEENGYDDIYNTNMVDLANPEQSILYLRMIDAQSPMPTWGLLTNGEPETVLVWIEEGGLNN